MEGFLAIYYEESYLKFRSIFSIYLNLIVQLLESVPGINQYLVLRIKVLTHGNNESL